jgi:putative acetyltransferase
MAIRDATPADVEAIRNVHRTAIRELGTDAYTETQVDAWARGCDSADYAATIESEETVLIVAERGGDVVGFGSLDLTPPEGYEATVDAEVTGVYVHPSVAREGVGTCIHRELQRRAGTRGVETLGLSASRNAVPFYLDRGYERVRTHTHEFSSHESTGVTGRIVEMKKRL